jgi:hypothetical protein
MPVKKIAISLEQNLEEQIRAAAAERRTTVSGWLANAAASQLQNEKLGAFLDAWEAEDGPFTEKDFEKVERAWPGSR